MYFLGIDGGGSKTHCIIGDEKGNIFTEGFGGPANYQRIGLEKTHISIMTAVHRALDKLNLKIEDIKYAVLGLAGADTAEDISALEQICKEIFKETPFKILNECWITLRTGNEENWGVVSICGIAHWTMGRNKDGDQSELRNMDYELGNRGGGREINAKAFHQAFRGEEGIGDYTELQNAIPKLLNVNHLDQVAKMLKNKEIEEDDLYGLPILVSELAKAEDRVCQDILIEAGRCMGTTAGAVIKKLGLAEEVVPIILTGSVFLGDNPLIIDAYMLEVHRIAPKAKCKILYSKPAKGAYYLAIEEMSL